MGHGQVGADGGGLVEAELGGRPHLAGGRRHGHAELVGDGLGEGATHIRRFGEAKVTAFQALRAEFGEPDLSRAVPCGGTSAGR